MNTVEEAIEHIQSGNARLRLTSLVSNNSYKYWIREQGSGKAFLVYLITAAGEIAYMGSISNGDWKASNKAKVHQKAPAYIAFTWIWKQLCDYKMPTNVTIEKIENDIV